MKYRVVMWPGIVFLCTTDLSECNPFPSKVEVLDRYGFSEIQERAETTYDAIGIIATRLGMWYDR